MLFAPACATRRASHAHTRASSRAASIRRPLQLLIEHGADVHAADCAGRTPLHFAAGNGRNEQAYTQRTRTAHVRQRSF